MNVGATIDFIKEFLPLLSPEGRVIVMSSQIAKHSIQPQKMRDFLTNPKVTEEEILEMPKKYV